MVFTQEETVALDRAVTYGEVLQVALGRLRTSAAAAGSAGLGMVCGPISTGGLGSIPANLQRFALAIATLQESGRHIFSQMPYETALHRVRDATAGIGVYDMKLLEEFYLPLFESGHVARKFFIPGWQSSTGTTWERNYALRLGIQIIDLGEDLLPL